MQNAAFCQSEGRNLPDLISARNFVIKTVASTVLFCFHYVLAAALFIALDLIIFSGYSLGSGIGFEKDVLLQRGMLVFFVAMPAAFFLAAAGFRIFRNSQSRFRTTIGFLTVSAVLFFVPIVVFSFSPVTSPVLTDFDYSLFSSAKDNFNFLPFSEMLIRVFDVLLPFDSFAETMVKIIGIGLIPTVIYDFSLFLSLTVSIDFFSIGRWPLFNLSAAVILFWILSGLHKLWLIAAAGFEISEIAFAVGISAVNFAVAVFFIAIRRMTVDPLR